MKDYGKTYRQKLIQEAIELERSKAQKSVAHIKPISSDEMSSYLADQINSAMPAFNSSRRFSGYVENNKVMISYEVTA